MEILLYKQTKDSDLSEGVAVCYKDTCGEWSKIGKITSIENQDGALVYGVDTSWGIRTADELKLCK